MPYDLLAVVPPHVVPAVVRQAGLAPQGWVEIDPETCETPFDNVFAIVGVTGVTLAMGKPLPKAGVFAHAQAEAVAQTIAAKWTGNGKSHSRGVSERSIALGAGKARIARGTSMQAYAGGAHEAIRDTSGRLRPDHPRLGIQRSVGAFAESFACDTGKGIHPDHVPLLEMDHADIGAWKHMRYRL